MTSSGTTSRSIAVVTGAANGIGHAIATQLRSDGFGVVGVDIDPEITTQDDLSAAIVGDVCDHAVLEEAGRWATELGSLTVWVNNAAVAISSPLHLSSSDDTTKVFDTNLGATYWGCVVAIRTFLHHDTAGVIINMSSIQASTPFPGWAAYATAKGGIETLTRYIASEYGGLGIRAVAVAPGTIATTMSTRAATQNMLADQYAKLQPLGRVGTPAEVAQAVSFAASPKASFVSGTTLTVDGAALTRSYPAPAFGDADRLGATNES